MLGGCGIFVPLQPISDEYIAELDYIGEQLLSLSLSCSRSLLLSLANSFLSIQISLSLSPPEVMEHHKEGYEEEVVLPSDHEASTSSEDESFIIDSVTSSNVCVPLQLSLTHGYLLPSCVVVHYSKEQFNRNLL